MKRPSSQDRQRMENELLLAGYKKRRSRSDTGWLEEWHKEERRSWYGTVRTGAHRKLR